MYGINRYEIKRLALTASLRLFGDAREQGRLNSRMFDVYSIGTTARRLRVLWSQSHIIAHKKLFCWHDWSRHSKVANRKSETSVESIAFDWVFKLVRTHKVRFKINLEELCSFWRAVSIRLGAFQTGVLAHIVLNCCASQLKIGFSF